MRLPKFDVPGNSSVLYTVSHSTVSVTACFIMTYRPSHVLQDILDVNTLELSRQLTLAYSRALREIRVSAGHAVTTG